MGQADTHGHLAGELAQKLERMLDELDRIVVRKKIRTRTCAYDENGKLTQETICDTEEAQVQQLDILDRDGFRHQVTTFKILLGGPPGAKATAEIPDSLWREKMNSAYIPYLDDPRELQIFFGGSSSGKSYAILGQRTIRDLMRGQRNYLICRKTARSIPHSCLNELQKCIEAMQLNEHFTYDKATMTLTCTASGYQAIFRGLDDVEKVKSITPARGVLTDVLIEEATETDYADYMQLTKRLRGRAEASKRVTLLFNPILQDHWIYTHFFEGKWKDGESAYSDEKTLILRTTYRDNRFLTAQDIARLEGETDQYYREVYTHGHWGVLGGAIFTNWEIAPAREDDHPGARVRNGLDFGYFPDPNAFVRLGYDAANKTIYVYRCAGGNGQDNAQLGEMIRPLIRGETVTCDNNKLNIHELITIGISAIPAKKGPGSVQRGIEWIRRQKIVVDPGCSELINELRRYKFRQGRDGRVLSEPCDRDNHWIDAMRYALEQDMSTARVT